MENVVGNKVLIHLHRQAYEMLSLQGIDSEKFIARVAGVDGFGLWVENPNYTTIPVFNDDGGVHPAGAARAGDASRRCADHVAVHPDPAAVPRAHVVPGHGGGSEIGFKSKLPKLGEGHHA